MASLDMMKVNEINYVITDRSPCVNFPDRVHFFCLRPNGRAIWWIVRFGDNTYSKPRAIDHAEIKQIKLGSTPRYTARWR